MEDDGQAGPGADPTTEVIEVQVEGTVELPDANPDSQLVPPSTVARPDADVEVLGAVLTPPVNPQVDNLVVGAQVDTGGSNGDALASTGPSDAWKILVMLSVVMMALGGLCLRWGKVV